MFNSWIRLDWGIIDNPVLSVMAQALTGYRMRTSNDHCSIPVEGSASIQRTLEKYINAATRRDFSGADDLFENILRSEEHTSELQSLMRISYAVFCLKKKKQQSDTKEHNDIKIKHNNK